MTNVNDYNDTHVRSCGFFKFISQLKKLHRIDGAAVLNGRVPVEPKTYEMDRNYPNDFLQHTVHSRYARHVLLPARFRPDAPVPYTFSAYDPGRLDRSLSIVIFTWIFRKGIVSDTDRETVSAVRKLSSFVRSTGQTRFSRHHNDDAFENTKGKSTTAKHCAVIDVGKRLISLVS